MASAQLFSTSPKPSPPPSTGKTSPGQNRQVTGDSDPEAALVHHMALNKPPADGHLFAYLYKDSKCHPLTKPEFI